VRGAVQEEVTWEKTITSSALLRQQGKIRLRLRRRTPAALSGLPEVPPEYALPSFVYLRTTYKGDAQVWKVRVRVGLQRKE